MELYQQSTVKIETVFYLLFIMHQSFQEQDVNFSIKRNLKDV